MCHFIVYNFQGVFMMLYMYCIGCLKNKTSDDLYVWHKTSWLQIQIMWRYRRSNTASLSPSHMYKNYFTSNLATMNQTNHNNSCLLIFMIFMSWCAWESSHESCVSQFHRVYNQKANPQEELYSFLVLCSSTFEKLVWSKENHPVWLIFS